MSYTEICDNIFFVEGLNRGRYFFSNSLLIRDERPLLIDSGTGPEIVERIAAEENIHYLLLSHGHEDHNSGNRLFESSVICAHQLDAPTIRSVKNLIKLFGTVSSELETEMEKFFKNVFGLIDCRVDKELEDGEIIETGRHRVEVIHTPGHSRGHCCFYIPESKIIFLADIDLSSFGPWYGCIDCHINDFIASVNKIKELDYEVAVSGHKELLRGKKEIDRNLDIFMNKIYEREVILQKELDSGKSIEDIAHKALIYSKFQEPEEIYRLMEKTMIEKHLEKFAEDRVRG